MAKLNCQIFVFLLPHHNHQKVKLLSKKYRYIQDDLQPILDKLRSGETIRDRLSGITYIVDKFRIKNEVLKRLTVDGWYQVTMRGIHLIFAYPQKSGIVVVPGKLSNDIPIGTLSAIWKQAKLGEDK